MEIKVMHQVMEWNQDVSAQVRALLREKRVCLINVMGSPGTGKTSLITSLIAQLRNTFSIGVIEGDITGQIDAEKIAALRIPAVQLNTDGACHIEAMSIQKILPMLPLDELDVIFVENIGNLVCDMLPYFDFNTKTVREDYRGVNPEGPLFFVSNRTGDGVAELAEHLRDRIRRELA